jgi:hypothetical protein
MGELAEMASSHHCSRIEWMTETGNRDAQEFYRQLGCAPSQGKLFCRIDWPAAGQQASGVETA